MLKVAVVVACAASVGLSAPEGFVPARYRAGAAPDLPVRAVGGGEAFLELSVDEGGSVTDVSPLRTTPPFTDFAISVARDWVFRPAEDDVLQRLPGGRERSVHITSASKVLFAAMYRPPVLNGFTLGEQPHDVAAPTPDVPYPIGTPQPPFPPRAREGGVVLLEARVGPDGSVSGIRVIRSAPPFDDPARAALARWLFRPARRNDVNVAAYVYVAFGFPIPVT
ncbi:MAG: energy transducer TonB [Vicinamibacterales bacterium]